MNKPQLARYTRRIRQRRRSPQGFQYAVTVHDLCIRHRQKVYRALMNHRDTGTLKLKKNDLISHRSFTFMDIFTFYNRKNF